jgi:hypothetical protein
MILKKSPASALVLFLPRESLRPEQRDLFPAGALNYWGDRILGTSIYEQFLML